MENSARTGVLQRLKSLYQTSQWHDLEFHLSDQETGDLVILRAHRLVLAPCSPVLEALCYGPMAEKGIIKITDVDPTGFDAMLQYLYTDFIQLKSVEVVSNVLYAAKKYLVPSLCDLAEKYLIENLSDSNCVDLFNLGCMLDDKDLEEKSYEHIQRRLCFVQKYVSSENVSTELLSKLVNADVLNCEEVALVRMSEMWAMRTCEEMNLEISATNVRNLLLQSNIFQQIRWSVLSDDDIKSVMPGLLADEEKVRQVDCGSTGPRLQCPFKSASVHRFVVNTKHRANIPQQMPIISLIRVNKSVNLRGIFILAKATPMILLRQSYLNYKERMALKIMDGDKILLEESLSEEVAYGTPFLWSLGKTLPLLEDTLYTMSILFSNSTESYPFGVMSYETKVPSGLVVHCTQVVDLNNDGVLQNAQDLSVISGFQFSY